MLHCCVFLCVLCVVQNRNTQESSSMSKRSKRTLAAVDYAALSSGPHAPASSSKRPRPTLARASRVALPELSVALPELSVRVTRRLSYFVLYTV
jgi:hypothetical protein